MSIVFQVYWLTLALIVSMGYCPGFKLDKYIPMLCRVIESR